MVNLDGKDERDWDLFEPRLDSAIKEFKEELQKKGCQVDYHSNQFVIEPNDGRPFWIQMKQEENLLLVINTGGQKFDLGFTATKEDVLKVFWKLFDSRERSN
jgi:hypothetical protein